MHKRCESMSDLSALSDLVVTTWRADTAEQMSLSLLMKIIPAACGLALLTFGFLVLAFSV